MNPDASKRNIKKVAAEQMNAFSRIYNTHRYNLVAWLKTVFLLCTNDEVFDESFQAQGLG